MMSQRAIDNRILAPSILSADFGHLAQDVECAEDAGAQWLHIDVMDGIFVPSVSIGFPVIETLRKHTDIFFDVHLMISEPGRYIDTFVKAGADHITLHVESEGNIAAVLDQIHAAGCTAGITLRPGTPVESLYPYLPKVEMALVMTVEPGFGGQSYMASQLPKVSALRKWANEHNPALRIEVDGGIKAVNAAQTVAAGADVLVAGSSIFNKKTPVEQAVKALQDALK